MGFVTGYFGFAILTGCLRDSAAIYISKAHEKLNRPAKHIQCIPDLLCRVNTNSMALFVDNAFNCNQVAILTSEKGGGMGTFSMKVYGEKYLGGKIEFESESGKGATFTFFLPKHLPAVMTE